MPGIQLSAVRKLDYDWPLIPHCTMPQRKHVPMGKPVIIGKMLAAKNPEPNFPHLIVCGCPPCCCPHVGTLASTSHVLINKMPAAAGIGGVGSPVIGCGVAGATNFPTVLIALT